MTVGAHRTLRITHVMNFPNCGCILLGSEHAEFDVATADEKGDRNLRISSGS